MNTEDMLVTMLFALDEHYLDYEPLLGISRALREQVDWESLRVRTQSSPFAKAFFTLVEELGIVPRPAPAAVPASGRVRVVPSGA
jgi:hypothetical protein